MTGTAATGKNSTTFMQSQYMIKKQMDIQTNKCLIEKEKPKIQIPNNRKDELKIDTLMCFFYIKYIETNVHPNII